MAKYQITAPDGKSYEVTAPDHASQDEVLAYAQANYKPQSAPETSTMGNLGSGIKRGITDVLDTIATQGYGRLIGNKEMIGGEAERQAKAWEAQNPDISSKVGRIGGNILATAPVTSILGMGAAAANLPRLANALRTGGMTTGAALPESAKWLGAKGADMALRAGAGGVGGAASAGLVNPDDIGAGAVIGAVAPSIIKGAGILGQKLGENAVDKYAEALAKYNRNAPKRETLKEAVDAGYVVPPNLVEPSAKNAIIESFSGKQATSQIASVKNQETTEKLVRQSLGLAEDAPLTKNALEQIRKIEGGAYKRVSELTPAAEADLEALKQARNEAQGWFNAYNRSASPADLAKAKEFRATSDTLELALENHAKEAGKDELIPALREARKQIAKTYTVQRALNDSTGTVNAKVIGRMFDKGKPLSDGLDTVGKFASGFPSVAKSSQEMGSPAAHNLRSIASMLAGGGGYAAAGPFGAGLATLPFIAPPIARSIMFREGAQKALANPKAPTLENSRILAELLQNKIGQQAIARGAPIAISQGQ
jgi:uncharacterized coiled-coil DUF342 family protein